MESKQIPTGISAYVDKDGSTKSSYAASVKAGHTETPWHIAQIEGRPVIRGGKFELNIAALMVSVAGELSADDNAAFIIRACNAHNDLLDLVERLHDALYGGDFKELDTDELKSLAANVRAKTGAA